MLRRCFPASIQSILEHLPESLDETYEHTLLGIDKVKRQFAHRLFQCLTVSLRPLRVEELAEILAVRFDAGAFPQFNTSWRLGDAEEAVLSACSSLITVVEVDGFRVVQFAHFSVKEFLTSSRLATASPELSHYYIVPHLAHATLAQASLGVLLQLDNRIDQDSIENFPLTDYAARYWFIHGQSENVGSTIRDATAQLFDREKPHFAAWVWTHDIDDPWREPTPTKRPECPEALPLYYAVLCGLSWLVEDLIAAYPRDINSRGGWHETPLLAALTTEDLDIALLLLRCGADINVPDNEGWSALHRASYYQRVGIVRLLLEHCADVNLLGYKNFTPLLLAACAGNLEISRLLIQHGADLSARNLLGSTPLIIVSGLRNVDIFRLLIDNGADVNSADNKGRTALHHAADLSHLDFVKFLLESGADFKIRDEDGQTALDIASDKGYNEVACFLSDYMAAAVTLDGVISPTPSAIKPQNRSPKVAPSPRESREANSPENEQPSLYTASKNGQLDIVRSLLDVGSDVNTVYRNRMTALHAASQKGELEVAKLLIERGAYVDSRSRAAWTALHYALRERHLEVARLLLDHGANVNTTTRNDGSALHLALFTGLQAIQLVLGHGVDVDVRNCRGRTAKQEAVAMNWLLPAAFAACFGESV